VPVDMTTGTVTAGPVIASGTEAIRVAREFAASIAAGVASDPVAWKYHHVGNYLLNGTLPPNHGQI
jgi:hypothetical protein